MALGRRRRSTSGEPIVGINCCAPPGTRQRGMQPTEDMHAQANIHNLGRRTRDVADACAPSEPSYVIQEVSFPATFSKFGATSVEKRDFPLMSKTSQASSHFLSHSLISLFTLSFQAQSATLTIAQAFNLAFELWQASQERKRRRQRQRQEQQLLQARRATKPFRRGSSHF